MLAQRRVAIQPILESAGGLHVSMYLEKKDHLGFDLRQQVRLALQQADEVLSEAVSENGRRVLMEPLRSLLSPNSSLSKVTSNIGIYRSESLFRIVSVATDVRFQCHVASSFHVKPLLQSLQFDYDFLLLGVSAKGFSLYEGTESSLKKVGQFFAASVGDSGTPQPNSIGGSSATDACARLPSGVLVNPKGVSAQEWLESLLPSFGPSLFLAGCEEDLRDLGKILSKSSLSCLKIAQDFSEEAVSEYCEMAREWMRAKVRADHEESLVEVWLPESRRQATHNLFQIAKAAVGGSVRKLVVADEARIFGKLDPLTGGLALHPCDLDHEDDDLLDDIAQVVLARGGEVLVAKPEEMPKGRPLVALLHDPVSLGSQKSRWTEQPLWQRERQVV